ncbi:MAG: protein jag [Deltaproteobacteria bacterium]|nr:protein jag [Deltaproteobacteria bacterium]
MGVEYEFEGKTKEDAVKKACEKLSLPEDQLKFDVISHGSTGIFGLVGSKKAKIKVRLPEGQKGRDLPEILPADKTEEVAQTAKSTLEAIISHINDGATVQVDSQPDIINLSVEGANSALLIGKHGRTLDALQYIVQKIVHKKKKTPIRISIDVEGYRARRKASLTQLALRLAGRVKLSGKPATISPMSAFERRIVHIALKDDPDVRTQSMGSGLLKKLVIFPPRRQK